MRPSQLWHTALCLSLFLAVAGVGTLTTADEVPNKAMPVPQKEIAQPFLTSLAGSWTTESTMIHEGKEMKGTGKATYELGIGGTALLWTYESNGEMPDGKPMVFHGHGVAKVSEDGKNVTVWWFCNMSPDVMKITGPLTDSGFDLTGDSPMGGPVQIAMKKTADGLSFTMKEGANEMRETYKRSR